MLLALSKFDPEVKELVEASAKYPLSRFAIHYEDNFSCLLPHLARFKGLAMLLQLRAVAHLENGQPEAAFEETKLSFRLSDSIQSETFLFSHLVRLAMENVILQTVKEGLARHAWTDAQLAHFQNYLGGINFLAEYDRSMRGERAFAIECLELARKGMSPYSIFDNSDVDNFSWAKSPPFHGVPSGWFFQNELAVCRFHEQFTFPAIDSKAQRAFPQFVDGIDERAKKMRITPYNIVAKLLLPAVSRTAIQSARAQTSVNFTRVACALERLRLATGQFPETLAALAPRFIDKLPHDIMNGEPLIYRRTDDGQYLLYSIGWNQKNDGGETAFKKGMPPSVDMQQGDWVWRIPAKK